ncbi:MAG: lysylphosphatidylglycerol synthase transmembrane domain-containing protein [Solirubrobacterales bacterium]
MAGSSDLEPKVAGEERAQRPQEVVEDAEPSFFGQPRRIAQTLLVVLILTAAIYVLLPKIIGLEDALATLDEGNPWWIALAVVFNILAFAAYVALFRGVIGESVLHLEWRESYQITMAGLAATRLFSAGGAGGIILTYWALRKAGMERRRSACRMLAFLVLLYGVYLLALVVFGILLRVDVLPGRAPLALTIIPAAIAGAVIVVFLLIALIPEDFERRLARFTEGYRFKALAQRIATAPATLASGTRTAIAFVRDPRRGGLALAGAIGFWAANIAILWASFEAFSVDVSVAVLVQGFFVGMVANLFPFAPGGVGAVDAGLIGAFVLFKLPSDEVFAAVLVYRLIAFWLPIPPGIMAFLQLRKTTARWEREREQLGAPLPAGASANADEASEETILQKVK